MRKRIFALIVSALAVTLTAPVLALPAFAAPEDEVNEAETEDADVDEEEPQETEEPAEQPDTKPFDAEAFLESYTTATTYDYYGDPYYDTDGNASLISDKHVIYSSDQIQFISVATKDGHVFYIIIDYTDHDGDNVYFLNKVDDFDMYRLLYAGKEDDEDTNIVEDYQAKQGNTDVTSLSGQKQKQGTVKTEATTPTEPADQQSGGLNIELLMYVGGGALFIIGLVAFFIFRVRSIKNKRIPTDDFDDDDDDEDIYGTGTGVGIQ